MFIATLQGVDGLIQGLAWLNGWAGHDNFFSDNSPRILLRLPKTHNSISMAIASGNYYR